MVFRVKPRVLRDEGAHLSRMMTATECHHRDVGDRERVERPVVTSRRWTVDGPAVHGRWFPVEHPLAVFSRAEVGVTLSTAYQVRSAVPYPPRNPSPRRAEGRCARCAPSRALSVGHSVTRRGCGRSTGNSSRVIVPPLFTGTPVGRRVLGDSRETCG